MSEFNLGFLTLLPGSTRKVTNTGTTTIVDKYSGGTAVVHDNAPRVGDPHPTSGTIIVVDYEIVDEEGDQATLTIQYQGVTLDSQGLPPPIFELDGSAVIEPITTHPDFISKLGGTATAKLHDAIFKPAPKSDPGQPRPFQEFPTTDAAGLLAGVTSYYVPGGKYSKKYSTFGEPEIFGVGTIDDPGAPSIGHTDQNWLKIGAKWVQKGAVYEVSESWLLSGFGGWNPDIYGSDF